MDIGFKLHEHIDIIKKLSENKTIISEIYNIIEVITNVFHSKGKVFFAGNGGSAADAQHLAAEFSGRFYFDREPLFSEALHVNTSYITAVANDYGYDHVYSRLIKAKGSRGDVLVGLSTSGNSNNIINALVEAKNQGVITIGFTGSSGGKMNEVSDYIIKVPSDDTPRIQETHILIGHIICEEVERRLFELSK